MSKSRELKTTQDVVMTVLQEQPRTRNSDNLLYYTVCKIIGLKNGINLDSISMPSFFLHMKDFGFPAFETVRRTRQKLQAEHPELSGNSTVKGQRMMNEAAFREYARG